MKIMDLRKIVVLATVICISMISASSGQAKELRELRVAKVGTLAATMDPNIVQSWGLTLAIKSQIFEGLLRYNPDNMQVELALAERWEVSKDGKTFTFCLRKGVQFHKGFGELTAEDVKATLDRHFEAKKWDILDKEKWIPPLNRIEVDETYFGGKRIKGERGRGASGKTPVFGILQRGGKVYTEVVPNCAKATLQAIIRGRVAPDSVIHSDQWHGYDGLVDLGHKKHYRVQHGTNEFVSGKHNTNGIESFWSFAKRRLMKFHEVPRTTFYLHLKECEFRFNYRRENIYDMVLKIVRENPLF